ncbi:fibronectin type III domain-containing protein, partial [Pasteurella multocida]|uniref:fibronectin type III domain-containing protein n=1 Tax=Pasteurella multocida TaxID=747 RepID=UPI002EA469D4|nr:fibronectin type III domain-containing protein [Pasteurella multocida]
VVNSRSPSVSDPPYGVWAEPRAGAAVVSWTPPEWDGGHAITEYVVTSEPGNFTATVSGNTTSVTVDNLSNGTAYSFSVVAVNDLGRSTPSVTTEAVTPVAAPSAPRAVTATPLVGGASVTWAPPLDDGGAAIEFYHVTASSGSTYLVPADVTTTAIEGQAPGSDLTFTVRAVNVAGESAESQPSRAIRVLDR